MQEAKFSDRYKGFLGLLGILTLVSLLVMNGSTTLLDSEEAHNILHVQNQINQTAETSVAFFPNTSQFLIYSAFGFSPFWLRMSNVVVFLLLLLGIRVWGGKIFGVRQTITFMILMVTSFVMISMAKFAVADIPLCAFHTMSFMFLVICLKQPKLKWQIVYGLFVMGSFFVQPVGAVVYGVGLLLYMLLFHKNSVNLRKPLILGVWIGFISLFYFLGGFDWGMNGIIFSYRTGWNEYFVWMLIGLLPWLGFLPAALWDLFQKLKKKEEMAIILFGWLLFAILSHALILQMTLLFLIARQVEAFFKPNYPHKNLVKIFSILNIVFTFFVLLFIMIGGYAVFAGYGYRSTIVISAIYWVLGIGAIIGLFSDSRRMIIGGMGLSGGFALLLFWAQINPIINQFREFGNVMMQKVETTSGESIEQVAVSGAIYGAKQFRVYSNASETNYQLFDGLDEQVDRYLLNQSDYEILMGKGHQLITIDTIMGGLEVFNKPEPFYILE